MMHTLNLKAQELGALVLSTPLDKLFCLLLIKEFIVSVTIYFPLKQRLYGQKRHLVQVFHFNLYKHEYIN